MLRAESRLILSPATGLAAGYSILFADFVEEGCMNYGCNDAAQ
ncbi:hypothetical Protein YC6258_00208 [Gynuella sunshinyii YC6258]|uniref:Uncharacterized protein n=1 Tax=Gynuella sunshinyii YC6258 TaxID=1445510 RepID=A0A0C5UYC2_9GAMM|nr:hypothetical Protein YC6258_00208 [Gynuella sunshinyii YC6258]